MPTTNKAVQWYPPGDKRHIPVKRVKRSREQIPLFYVKAFRGEHVDLTPGDWILRTPNPNYRYPVKVE